VEDRNCRCKVVGSIYAKPQPLFAKLTKLQTLFAKSFFLRDYLQNHWRGVLYSFLQIGQCKVCLQSL